MDCLGILLLHLHVGVVDLYMAHLAHTYAVDKVIVLFTISLSC